MKMNRKNMGTALLIALLIGTLLNAINNYDVIAEGKLSGKHLLKIILTYITPFCVSLYSSVKAQRAMVTKHN
jgi:hypothetical protein